MYAFGRVLFDDAGCLENSTQSLYLHYRCAQFFFIFLMRLSALKIILYD